MKASHALWGATKGTVKEPTTYFTGVAAMIGESGSQVCFVAPNIELLREMWGKYTEIPLNEEGLMVQEVAIFQRKNVTP